MVWNDVFSLGIGAVKVGSRKGEPISSLLRRIIGWKRRGERGAPYEGDPGCSLPCNGATAQPLPFLSTPIPLSLCRKYFLAWAYPRQRSCLHCSHTFSYCSWRDLRGGFNPKRGMYLQDSRTLEILCSAVGWVFPLPSVAGLIWRWGGLNFGGTHASVFTSLCFFT